MQTGPHILQFWTWQTQGENLGQPSKRCYWNIKKVVSNSVSVTITFSVKGEGGLFRAWCALGKMLPKAVDFLVMENSFSGKVTSNLNCFGYENNILRISRLCWLFVLLKLVSKWCKYRWTLLIRLRPVRQMKRYLVDLKAGSLWEGGCLDMEAGGSSFECTLTA